MNKESLVKLRRQLDTVLDSGTPEAVAALARDLAGILQQFQGGKTRTAAAEVALEPVLQALEDAWLKGRASSGTPLPGNPEQQARLGRLVADMLAVQDFAISLAKGDLAPTLNSKGTMAGGLKSLQASLRHLTWQTQMIAKGDFSQRVDFMGEFSKSFNAMTLNLAAAREELRRHGEELAQANVSLRREIAERQYAETLIQKLNQQLNQKVADLEAANQDMEAFSYSVSHDLRAPLRAIAGYARLLREDHGHRLDGESLRLLAVISENARLMGQLIEDILAFARLGRQEIKKTAIDMTALTQSVFAALQGLDDQRQVVLTVQDLPPAYGDRTLIQQVLANLLTNALKFTGPKAEPAIAIRGWQEGNETVYAVADNGVGFDMQYVDKLFNVFQRLHLQSEFEGTGVGLAIVHKIILRHGGRVWADGRVNEGATFYFALPRG